MKEFDYDKAEADLYESGCRHTDEIYSHRSKQAIENFMRENELDPAKYYKEKDSKKSSDENNSGCYLTTACVKARNLPDDCEELTVLRTFRDSYMAQRVNGAVDIKQYYRIAPEIVKRIDSLENADEIWDGVYNFLVLPSVALIKKQKYEAAYQLYKDYALKLEKQYCR